MVADMGLERNSDPSVTDQSEQMARRSIMAVIKRDGLAVACSGTSFKGAGMLEEEAGQMVRSW